MNDIGHTSALDALVHDVTGIQALVVASTDGFATGPGRPEESCRRSPGRDDQLDARPGQCAGSRTALRRTRHTHPRCRQRQGTDARHSRKSTAPADDGVRPQLRHRQRAVACQAVRARIGQHPDLIHAPLSTQTPLHPLTPATDH
uniref:Uncharacterized protein n=1 Tax=Panagrolaimus superbus TaxID=310955 RepID=A0A914Z8Y9_9BILA